MAFRYLSLSHRKAKECSKVLPKRQMQQRLKQMLRLALGFPLLGAQLFKFLDNVGEFLLEEERGQRYF
jgi:hypothetical protein